MASQLPGFPETAGVAVGISAVAAVLRLPLSAVVIATLLTAHTGAGVGPLIIVGVVVSYVVTLLLARRPKSFSTAEPERAPPPAPSPAPEPEPEPVGVS